MEEFFKALRSDLGISNFGLGEGDLASLMLRHGDLYVRMLRQNKDMPLAELGAREKALEATKRENT